MTSAPGSAASESGRSNSFARQLFTPLPSRYDRLAELLSFGQNGRWRRAMTAELVARSPSLVLDVATGPGAVAREIVRRSDARVVGVDVTEAMLRQGLTAMAAEGLSSRVSLLLGRGEQLPFPDGTFDALSFTYLLRYVEDPAATLSELARVVKPGGVVASLEFYAPPSPVWRALWWAYTRTVLPAAGRVLGGPEWQEVGRFLGPSISRHYRSYSLAWTIEAWQQAGIGEVAAAVMSLGGGLVMWGVRQDG